MLEAAYARALRLIRLRVPRVRAVASALLHRRALAHADIRALLGTPQAGASGAQTTRPSSKHARRQTRKPA